MKEFTGNDDAALALRLGRRLQGLPSFISGLRGSEAGHE